MVTAILPETAIQHKAPLSDHFVQLLPAMIDELEAEWRRRTRAAEDVTSDVLLRIAHYTLATLMETQNAGHGTLKLTGIPPR